MNVLPKRILFSLLVIIITLLIGCYPYNNQGVENAQVPVIEEDNQSNQDSTEQTITFVYTRPIDHPVSQWYFKVYEEAFMRLGYEFEFEFAPPERASTFTSDGLYDGESSRVSSYAETHANLIRVDEPVITVKFSAFSTKQYDNLRSWDDILQSDLVIAYRFGVAKVESNLVQKAPENRFVKTYSNESAIDRLVEGNADIYIDVESYVYSYLKSDTFSSKNYDQLIRNIGMIESDTGHAFLNIKHAELAPKLSQVLRDMKSEGLFQAYFDELGLEPTDIYIHTLVE